MEEADTDFNLRSVSLCTAGKAQEAEAPEPILSLSSSL